MWQECRGSKGNQYSVNISVRNYLIPDGCDPIDGGYGNLMCSNPTISIVNNGDEEFSDLLLKQYQENNQYVFDKQLNAVVLSYLFDSKDEYMVVMFGPERTFTLSFWKEKHNKDFVAGYIRSVQLPNDQ